MKYNSVESHSMNQMVLITCALWWFIGIVTTVVATVTEDVEIDAAPRRATELRQGAAGCDDHPSDIYQQQ